MSAAALSENSVMRIARRMTKPGCGPAYEALVRGMFGDAGRFPGFLGAELIPPVEPGGEYQVVVKFATEAQMAAWDASDVRLAWHERMLPVTEGPPEYRLLTGLEAWIMPPAVATAKPPARARMALASWLGIFPTVACLQMLVSPWLADLPFLLRIGVFTGLVVVLMTWVVMPRLSRWLRPWLVGR